MAVLQDAYGTLQGSDPYLQGSSYDLQPAYGSLQPSDGSTISTSSDTTTGDGTASTDTGGSTIYTAEQLQASLEGYNRTVAAINRAYQAGLLSFEDQQNMIRDTRDRNLRDLQSSRETADQQNSSYFSQISPDAFQSQIGNYNQKILSAYKQGVDDTNTDFGNNQTKIDFAKGQFEAANQDALAQALSDYNLSGGSYTGGDYSSGLNASIPTLQPKAINTSTPLMASPGIARFSPNANIGGTSTRQAQNKPQSELDKFLYGG